MERKGNRRPAPYPTVSRLDAVQNPTHRNGRRNIARAQSSDFRKALHQLHHTPKALSALTVRVLPNTGNSTAAKRAIALRCFLAWLAGGISAQSQDSRPSE